MIAGVELSAEEDGKERHVLGYAAPIRATLRSTTRSLG